MTLERFCIKFFTQSDKTLTDSTLIEIFHAWIRDKKIPLTLLDVADYAHVPEGPGIMLISHEINFALDDTNSQFGLLAQRKTGSGLSQQEKLLELLRATLQVGTMLEADSRLGGQLKLEGGSFEYQANDRLLVPNTAAGFAVVQADLEAVAALLYPGQQVSISRVDNDPRSRLTVRVDSGSSVNLQTLLDILSVPA